MSDGEVFNSDTVSAHALRSVAQYIGGCGMSGWSGSAICDKLYRDAAAKDKREKQKSALVAIGRLVLDTVDDPAGPLENEEDQAARIGAAALRGIRERADSFVGWTIAPPIGYDDVTRAYTPAAKVNGEYR